MLDRDLPYRVEEWVLGRRAASFMIHLDPRSRGRRFPTACSPGAVLRPVGNAYHRRDERLSRLSSSGDQLLCSVCSVCSGNEEAGERCRGGTARRQPPHLCSSCVHRAAGAFRPMPDQLAFSANVPLFCSKAVLPGPAFSLSLAHCNLAWNWFALLPAVLFPSFLLDA